MTELATASLEVPQTGSSSAMGAQAAPAAPRKRRAPAGLKCSEPGCGKRFTGPRAASKLGAHKYAKHVKGKAVAAAPAFSVAATIKVLEAQRDRLTSAIAVLKAV